MAEAVAPAGTSKPIHQIQDGATLKAQRRRANRRNRLNAFLLTARLLLFLLASFIAPIGMVLFRSVDDPIVGEALPRTVVALESWDRAAPPDETV